MTDVPCLLLSRPSGTSLEFLVPTADHIKVHVHQDGGVLVENMALGAVTVAYVQEIRSDGRA